MGGPDGYGFAEAAAALLILIPCVLLLAWEERLSHVFFFWTILLLGSGVFLGVLLQAERKRGRTLRQTLGRCGGFGIMFLFIAWQVVSRIF